MARILVVDDDENRRILFEDELSNAGHEVVLASDGQEAIEVAATESLDLVVLDISMPKVDGLEAMGRMLSQDRGLPIILHSAYTMYKDDFQSWSADAYVVKSSDLTELMQKIDELLAKRQ